MISPRVFIAEREDFRNFRDGVYDPFGAFRVVATLSVSAFFTLAFGGAALAWWFR